MKSNITICTAFFDIGRSQWPLDPPYLRRSNEHYFHNFERLLKLDNPIIVHTSLDMLSKFEKYNSKENLTVVPWTDWKKDIWPAQFELVAGIQPSMGKIVQQPWNPEYWSPEYVMVNMLKSYFVHYSFVANLVETDLAAWIDFGYARQDTDVPTNIWNCPLDSSKIHLFTIKPNLPTTMDVINNIITNDVWITGCHIVAGADGWKNLLALVYSNLNNLLSHYYVDDDQTILQMAYCTKPELFDIHHIDPNDWFCIFRKYNNVQSLLPTNNQSW